MRGPVRRMDRVDAAAGRRPRVLLVHSSADLYGSDKCLVGICRALVPAAEVHVLLPEDGPLVGELEAVGAAVLVRPIAVIRRSCLKPASLIKFICKALASYVWMARFVARGGYDIVHANTTAVYWVCYARLTCPGVRYVTHVRELILRPGWLGRVIYSQVARYSDAVIAISTEVKDALTVAAPRLAARSILMHDGLDEKLMRWKAVPRHRTRKALGVPDDAVLIACVGRFNFWKGQDVLLEAFMKVKGACPGAQLMFIGDAYREWQGLMDSIVARAKDAGLSGSVHFLGYRADVMDLLYASDIFVLPSVQPEPFGMVLLEAMAASLPIVATDGGGPRDVVVAGETGYLVPFADAGKLAERVVELASDPGLRDRMGSAGHRRLEEKFSESVNIGMLADAYGL